MTLSHAVGEDGGTQEHTQENNTVSKIPFWAKIPEPRNETISLNSPSSYSSLYLSIGLALVLISCPFTMPSCYQDSFDLGTSWMHRVRWKTACSCRYLLKQIKWKHWKHKAPDSFQLQAFTLSKDVCHTLNTGQLGIDRYTSVFSSNHGESCL